MKKLLVLLVLFCPILTAKAVQFDDAIVEKSGAFKHLDVALTLGSTGIGFDLATPVYADFVQLRAGYAFMPGFRQTMTFGVDNYTKDGTIVSSKKEQVSELMKKFTGYDIDYEVDMVGVPTYHNAKLLVDVFPFKNKKWHFTTGFYVGPSRIAKAYNTTEDMARVLGTIPYEVLTSVSARVKRIYVKE